MKCEPNFINLRNMYTLFLKARDLKGVAALYSMVFI